MLLALVSCLVSFFSITEKKGGGVGDALKLGKGGFGKMKDLQLLAGKEEGFSHARAPVIVCLSLSLRFTYFLRRFFFWNCLHLSFYRRSEGIGIPKLKGKSIEVHGRLTRGDEGCRSLSKKRERKMATDLKPSLLLTLGKQN